MKKITISAGALYGNRGAEAMTVTTIAQIRKKFPDTRFGIMTPYPKKDRKLIDKDANCVILSSKPAFLAGVLFPCTIIAYILKHIGLSGLIKRMPKEVSFIASSDMQLDVAGVSFIDGREKFLPFNILTILTALLFKVPVYKLSQAMGPFKNPVNRFFAKRYLFKCMRIFARGEATLKNFDQLKVPAGILHRADDIVFLNDFGDPVTSENLSRIEMTLAELDGKNSDIIGFCPSAVIYKKSLKERWDYIDLNIRIIEFLQSRKYHVLLFPNATREDNPDELMNNDIPVIREIMARIREKHTSMVSEITVVDFDANSDGIKRFIEKTSLCLVSRFHAMIFALNLHKPLIVIGWSHKYEEVLKQFDLSDYVFDYKNLDLTKIGIAIDKLEKNHTIIAEQIKSNLVKCRAEARRQFDHIEEFLSKK